MSRRSTALAAATLAALLLGACAVAAAAGPGTPAGHLYRKASGSFAVGDKPVSLGLTSVGEDGFEDLVVGSAGAKLIQVLQIRGGRLAAVSSRRVPVTPTVIGIGDSASALVAGRDGGFLVEFRARFDRHHDFEPLPTAIAPRGRVSVGPAPAAILATLMRVSSLTPEGTIHREGTIDYIVAGRGSSQLTLVGRNRHRERPGPRAQVQVGAAPASIAQGNSEAIYVANSGSGTISKLGGDLLDGAVHTETITVGGEPVAVAEDNFIWGDKRDNEIAVLDRAGRQVLILDRPLQVPYEPFQPYRVTQRYAVGKGPVALLAMRLDDRPGIDLAIVNTLSNSVSVLRGTGKGFAPGGAYATGRRPVAIVPIGYGRYFGGDLAVANRGSDDLTILVRNEFGRCRGRPARLRVGTAASDILGGEHGPNETNGGTGGDLIRGGGAADCLRGGAGDDELTGGSGDDLIWTGPGRDRADGQSGDDTIFARGGGHDRIRCGSGTDTVYADRGDSLYGCERRR